MNRAVSNMSLGQSQQQAPNNFIAFLNNQSQSSSCLDLINNNNNLITQDKERLKTFLPGYRSAPDYETAVNQQKYRTNERVASDPHINIGSGSQPDIHRVTADTISGRHLQRTPDVTRTSNMHGLTMPQQLQMMRINQRPAPPPYPPNRLNSKSTPDLALASHRALYHQQAYVSAGSSPDLLSTRTFLNSHFTGPQPPTNALRCRHAQSYNGNLNGSIEPIYENRVYESRTDVSNGTMRDRAFSNQSSGSGGGVMRFKQQQPQRHNKTFDPIAVHHQVLQNSQSLESINQATRTSTTPNDQSRLNRRHVQFDPINRSQSTSNVLESHSNLTTGSSFNDNNSGQHDAKEKKKRRWKFWGGRGKVSLSGKTKASNKIALTKEQEIDSRHRWSTGLPRQPILSTTISKEKLCQILEAKLVDPQLYVEFERIPKRKANACYDCALHAENRLRNFDPNFLPYDDNRVRLTPTRENRLGYYNASYVTATVGSRQRFYIVAQSPHVLAALDTFLQCVWEADVYLLVQLSDDVSYVPPTCDKCVEYGQYKIWKEFSEVTDQCVTSKLRLYHTVSRRYRSVWHLRYCEWAVQNCPKDVGHFLEFLEELCSVRLASINEVPPGHNTNPPIMIHCNEGGGRAGVTLLADLLLYTLDNNQDLDIPRVLSQLREQRDHIIPSLAQYKFVYALLINYLKHSRLI